MIEEKDYFVILTLTFSSRVSFSEMERAGPITEVDAIANFLGQIPEASLNDMRNGFNGEWTLPTFEFTVHEE